MIDRWCIRVSGRVQGVFFRASAQAAALEMDIKGFVRNEPDGTVYTEAEGAAGNLERFLEWCSHGPEHAKVQDVQVTKADPIEFTSFEITY